MADILLDVAENKTRSFYLPPDVLEYLASSENASAKVTELVRREKLREDEAAAYQRIHGHPVTERARERAKRWSREQLAAAAAHADQYRDQNEELRRQLGWTG